MESFLSHSAEKFGRGTNLLCCVSESFWQRECFEKEVEGVLKVSVERVLSHSAEKFGRGTTLLCCVSEKSWQRKYFEKEGEGVPKFQSVVFCLTVPKIWLGEKPFCAVFQRISGSEKVLKRRGKEYQKFQSKLFCLTVPKILVGGTTLLCYVSENFWQRKSFGKEGGVSSIKSFRGKFFVSQCRQIC